MKLLAALTLALCSCASMPPPPAGWFDCSWARVTDFSNHVEHQGMPRWAPMICGGDPTAVGVDGASRVGRPVSLPAPASGR